MLKKVILLILISALFLSCSVEGENLAIEGHDIELTIFHTTDIHSRILPTNFEPLGTDKRLGLLQENGPLGGAARLMTLLKRERKLARRHMYVDSGDWFQGAPIFNMYSKVNLNLKPCHSLTLRLVF